MITLYQYPPKRGVPNLSHFCMKLEGWLKMAELDYEVHEIMDPRKTPKGKAPFIKDSGGTVVADSSVIIQYLTERYNVKLDENLTAEQCAQAICIQRMLEDHLYWAVVYSRWVDEVSWPTISETWFGGLPFPMNKIVPRVAQKDVVQNLHRQGLGRQEPAEIYRQGIADIDALAGILAERPFLLGDQPQGIDAGGFAWVVNFLYPNLPETPLTEHAKSLPVLAAYAERMQALYWKGDTRFSA